MTKQITAIDKISMIVLLLAPILWIYGNPGGWSFEELLTIPLSAIYFVIYLVNKKSINGKFNPLPKGLTLYFAYWGVLTLITAFALPLAVLQCYLTFFLFFATFHNIPFIKMYKIFALICIVLFFAQEITFHTTGIRISGILKALPFHINMSMADYIELQAASVRSSSFFSEPAHLAQFLLPLLAIELFYDKGKRHYLYAMVIGVVLLLLQSGNGLIGLVPILLFALPYFLQEKKRYRWLTIFVFTCIISVAGYLFFHSEMGGAVLERQSELDMVYSGGNRSGFLRIWRGFFVYGDYNFFEKIFGCPNEVVQLSHVYSSGMSMGMNAELYFNAFQKILLNTGLVGMGLFVYIIAQIWRGNTICGKAILATLVSLSFISAIYMSHTMILFLVLAESMRKRLV